MVALASVPITAYLHTLTIYQMYAVALVVGIFTVSSTSPTSPTCRR